MSTSDREFVEFVYTTHRSRHLHVDEECDRFSETPTRKPIESYPSAWREWCSHCAGDLQ